MLNVGTIYYVSGMQDGLVKNVKKDKVDPVLN
jgi:hypothetical protein